MHYEAVSSVRYPITRLMETTNSTMVVGEGGRVHTRIYCPWVFGNKIEKGT
jgi:hypothetical protein